MSKCQSSMRFGDGKQQIKYKGIHEPKGRVKGFRVEIRPRNSTKIWVGTFDTRAKAMRAFDAAVHLTGKEPYYFIYPDNYFPSIPNKPSKEFVQTQAKIFAEKTDVFEENPVSFLVVNSKAEASPRLTRASGIKRTTLVTPDVKTAEELYPPLLPTRSERLHEVDEFLKNSGHAELVPALRWDVAPVEAVAKGDVEEGYFAGLKETELAAFDKGYYNPDFDALCELLDRNPPDYIYPFIPGETFTPVFSPSRPASKRKRDATERAITVTDDDNKISVPRLSAATGTSAMDDCINWDEFSEMAFHDPVNAVNQLEADAADVWTQSLLNLESQFWDSANGSGDLNIYYGFV